MNLDETNLDQFLLSNRPANTSRHPQYPNFLLELNEYLSEARDDYFALAPCGSQLKGIALPDSDFDVIIIGGDSLVTTHNEIDKMLNSFCTERFGKNCNTPSIARPSFFSANFVQHDQYKSEYGHAAWMLAYPFVGDISKINELRSQLRKRHQGRLKVDPLHATKNFEDSVSLILRWELGMDTLPRRTDWIFQKLLDRGYSESDLTRVVAERDTFWRERIAFMLEA